MHKRGLMNKPRNDQIPIFKKLMQKPTLYTATVSSVNNVAGDFYVATIALTDPKEMHFLAGQYVIFQIGPPKLRHTLSIASSPVHSNTIDILQSVVPMGEGSKWLLGLKPGDPVQFLGPLGKFVLQKESPRPKVFVATGCGIAPLRAMIMDELNGQGTGNNKQMTLFWGLRYEENVFWETEFEELSTQYPNFHSTITLSQPTDRWTGTRGRVTEHVVAGTPDLVHAEFYLCGSRAMIVDMKAILADNGVPQSQIYTEAFF